MPVYNTKPTYLGKAIESILHQTLKDFKFLILNDSPENPYIKNIVKKYNDKRIIYYEHTSNLGIARSYNHLLSLADTKYIALMNHDDISLPVQPISFHHGAVLQIYSWFLQALPTAFPSD